MAWKRPAELCCLWMLLGLFVLTSGTGCRALRRRQASESLASARQLSLQGAEALEQQKWNEAETLFQGALAKSEVDERAHWGVAEAMWQRGEHKKATEHLLEAVKLSGSNPDLSVRLGQMYLEQSQLDQAANQAKLALKNNRKHAGAWALQGDVCVNQQKWDEALSAYHQALVYQPDFPAVQIAVAELYRKMGKPNRSLATLDRLIDKHPIEEMPARVMWLRGCSLAELGRSREAADALVKARDMSGRNDAELLVEISRSQEQLGDMVQARMTIGRVIQLRPDHPALPQLQADLDRSFEQLANQGDIESEIRR